MPDHFDPTEPLLFGSEPTGAEPMLATVVRLLTAPADPSEIAAEATVVELMARTLNPTESTKDRHMKFPFARYVAITAVVLVSASGVAAAATGTNPLGMSEGARLGPPTMNVTDDGENDPPPPVQTTTSTTSTSTTTTSTTTTSTPAVPSSQDAEADECRDTNHGAKVSAVAKDKTDDGELNHGAVVSAAAHDKTSCGGDDDEDEDDDRTSDSATPRRSDKSNPGRKLGNNHD